MATLGLGEFPRGLTGGYNLPGFPGDGATTLIGWQESQQNFFITGAPSPTVDQNLCTTQTGTAVDTSGGSASLSATNPCLAEIGKTVLVRVASQRVQSYAVRRPRAVHPGVFLYL